MMASIRQFPCPAQGILVTFLNSMFSKLNIVFVGDVVVALILKNCVKHSDRVSGDAGLRVGK
jgi:hypothetical protein